MTFSQTMITLFRISSFRISVLLLSGVSRILLYSSSAIRRYRHGILIWLSSLLILIILSFLDTILIPIISIPSSLFSICTILFSAC